MFNLLPETEKKEILKEYSVRRSIVLLGFVFVLGIITAIALLPSYIITSAKVAETNIQIEDIRQSSVFQEADRIEKNLSQSEVKIDLLKATTNSSLEKLINLVLEVRLQSIRINGFQFKIGDDKEKGMLTVQGIARDRESLSQFVKKLQSIEQFEIVNLPVSNFAKDRNAEFSIEIRGSF